MELECQATAYDGKKADRLKKELDGYKQRVTLMSFKPMLINIVIMVVSTVLVNYLSAPRASRAASRPSLSGGSRSSRSPL